MSTDRIQRMLPLFGVLFAAVLVAGLVLTSGEPDAGSRRGEIFTYWHAHHGIQLISNLLLIPFGVVFLLGFTAALRSATRSGEASEAVYSPLVLAGGVIAAVGLLVTGMLGAAVTSAAHRNARDSTYTLAQLQSYDWVTWMVGLAVLLLASGVGGLRTGALPKSLALAATCLGVLFLTPVGFFALFAFPLWAAAAGIALYRAEQRASRRRVRPAAAAGLALLVVTAVCSSAVAASPGKGASGQAATPSSTPRAILAARPFHQGRYSSPLTPADFTRFGGRMDPGFPRPWVITIRKGRWHTNESPSFGGTYVLAGSLITFVVKYPADAAGTRQKLGWTYGNGRLRFKVVSGVEGGDQAIYLAHPWRRLGP